MKCPNCNAPNQDGQRFCANCGAKLEHSHQENTTFRCNRCNQPLRLGLEQVGVDSRGLPIMHNHGYCDNCMLKFDLDSQPPVQQAPPVSLVPPSMRCGRCGSSNINISLETFGEKSKGRSEVRKKSIVTRAGNSIGRATMIGVTCGLWALTPKKSKYNTVGKSKTNYTQQKMAICQNCGFSWYIQ